MLLTAYKVFDRLPSGQLTSVRSVGLSEIQYSREGWNSAPKWLDKQGYGPLVFNDLKTAIAFHQGARYLCPVNAEIWIVEGEQISLPEVRCIYTPLMARGKFDAIRHRNIIQVVDHSWPPNTAMVKAVRLVKPLYIH